MGYTERARNSASDSRHPVQPRGRHPYAAQQSRLTRDTKALRNNRSEQGGLVVAALPLATGVERDRRDGIDGPV